MSTLNNANKSDSESLDIDEIEPKLKYIRMANDMQDILSKDAISYVAVHTKFVCVGTHWGKLYLLDHQGNKIISNEIKPHSQTVNQISIDKRGEYIASCSEDGKILIQGLYDTANNYVVNIGKPIKCVALEPDFSKNFQFITGNGRLVLHEKSFLNRIRTTVLCEAEGSVCNIAWNENGQFIAWSSLIGIRVYDLYSRCSLGLIKWDNNDLKLENYPCNLRWSDQCILLIGWVDMVRVCAIRKRTNFELESRDYPEYLVDPLSTFQTDFYVCGIAPFSDQLVMLGLNKESGGKMSRPQLHITECHDNDYIDTCTDCLNLRGYQEYNFIDYHLEVLKEENRFFIITPKDLVVACPYDIDDRVSWFINHNKFDDAVQVLLQNSSASKKYNIINVGKLYLNYLLAKKDFDAAGQLCLKVFGNSKQLWEEEIYKFRQLSQLRAISPYIPCSLENKLDPHIYEMVLYEFLSNDAEGFLKLVKEWNWELYNTNAVISALLNQIIPAESHEKNILLESLALLYSYEGNYENSLITYFKLKHPDVFLLIEKYNLYSSIESNLIELMELDADRTIQLITEKKILKPEVVVNKLKSQNMFLYKYLDVYCKIDTKCSFNSMLVGLYATFDREKLLPFLRSNDSYSIHDALKICMDNKFYSEIVYLLSRIGNTKEALEIIVTKLNDMNKAIIFCQEHNDAELWHDLINHSLKKPEYINYLLQRIATYVDPRVLVQQIQCGVQIKGLKNSLVKMLRDYHLQVSVQDGCKKILMRDYFNLHEKVVNAQQRGLHMFDNCLCSACHRKIIYNDLVQMKSIILFNCRHAFHEECLSPLAYLENCVICNNIKSTK